MQLNIKRAVEEIRLSNDADSPVFYLDMTDANMPKIANEFEKYYRKFMVLQARINEENVDEVACAKEATKLLKQAITVLLGKEACDATLDYIKGGAKLADYNVMSYLARVVAELVTFMTNEYINPLVALSEREYVDVDKQRDFKVI